MVHEIIGVLTAVLVGAVIVSALSKNANTANVLGASFDGFKGLVDAVTAPVRG